MSAQFLLTVDFPNVSIGRVVSSNERASVTLRGETLVWPPDDDVMRQPSVRSSWNVDGGRLRLVWS